MPRKRRNPSRKTPGGGGSPGELTPGAAPRLSALIRSRQEDIVRAWESAVRQLPLARDLERPALIDHIPALIDRIAGVADALATGGRGSSGLSGLPGLTADLAAVPAPEWLEESHGLAQVVTEYGILRDCIVQVWSAEALDHTDSSSIRALNQAIDHAIAASVQRYTLARDRTLESLDRISAAALETRSLDDFLGRLLGVLLETTAAADIAAILLREGDRLRLRAFAGPAAAAVAPGWSVRIGEGFAGVIAKTGRPHAVPSAVTDPLVLSPREAALEAQALFGVPLVEGGEVIGVALMGSRTARELSKQDQRMVTAMAHRAMSAISLHMLREAAERRARQQHAIAALGVHALAPSDLDALLAAVVRCVTDTLSTELASILEVESDHALVVRAELGWGSADVLAMRVPSEGSQAGATVRTGQPVIVDDVADEVRFSVPDVFRERGIHSGISVPIRLPGELEAIHGVLAAHTVRPRAFSSDDVAFLQAVGHILGTAIALRRAESERARVLAQEQARRAELERTQAALEEALRQQHLARLEAERSLAVLDTILASSALGIGFLDNDLRYVRVNDSLAALNGTSAAQHVGRTVREVLGEVPASFLEPLLRRVIETRQPIEHLELDVEDPARPGLPRSFLANYVPVVTLHGELLGVGAVVIEVTERKRMELAIRERELQFRSIADNIPQLAWMADETR